MLARQETKRIELGGAALELTPLEPGVWEPLAARADGAASLCLELLALAAPVWSGEPVREALERLPAGAVPALLEALRAPWLSPAQEETLERLRLYLEARADFPGLDCADCAAQERAGEGAPDCAACPLPPLPPEGWEALRLAGLLRSLPPEAGALLPGLLAGRTPGEQRFLLAAWGLVHSRLERPHGPAPEGMLE
ncbi:MAG: hypothetical protein KQH53_00215 [Desulfarculaceae bacterium]|nr:hypothetical protein [Desulfarculaceae bacterium]